MKQIFRKGDNLFLGLIPVEIVDTDEKSYRLIINYATDLWLIDSIQNLLSFTEYKDVKDINHKRPHNFKVGELVLGLIDKNWYLGWFIRQDDNGIFHIKDCVDKDFIIGDKKTLTCLEVVKLSEANVKSKTPQPWQFEEGDKVLVSNDGINWVSEEKIFIRYDKGEKEYKTASSVSSTGTYRGCGTWKYCKPSNELIWRPKKGEKVLVIRIIMENKIVDIDFIKHLQEKFDSEPYTEDELIKCYAIENEKFIACENSDGYCYVEEFENLEQCLRFLNTHDTAEEIKGLPFDDFEVGKEYYFGQIEGFSKNYNNYELKEYGPEYVGANAVHIRRIEDNKDLWFVFSSMGNEAKYTCVCKL